ncbi:Hypothetical protein FKW44_004947, partial [Caligus rogercresseyi]
STASTRSGMERASSESCFERIPAHQGQEVHSMNQTVNGKEESGEDQSPIGELRRETCLCSQAHNIYNLSREL